MPSNHARFGTDIRLLNNLDRQKSSRDPGHDLAVTTRDITGQIDLETLNGVENLTQALLLRFLTPVGELTQLGHSTYGSRLFELIGELNSEANRNRAKMYVLQALGAEPRVKKVRSVRVTQNRARREQIDIEGSLIAVDDDTTLNLVFPFFLDGGVTP